MTTQDHLHRRRLDRVHEEHRRRRAAAPGARGRRDRADGHQPAAARRKRDRRRQAGRRRSAARPRSRPIPTSARRSTAPISSSSPSRSAATSPARSPISRCRRNTACARPSPTRSASAASCAACAPCRISGRSARTCCRSAPTRSCCNTSTRWRSTPGRSPRNTRRSSRSASAIRCRARRWSWPAISTSRYEEIRYRAAGINHMAFYLKFEHRQPDGSYRDLYPGSRPRLSRGPRARSRAWNPRCPNKVRYEMLTRLGYFVTESSEHFAEYTPYFIKEGRAGPDREIRHSARRIPQALHRADRSAGRARPRPTARPTPSRSSASQEYASSIMNSVWTGEPSVIYGNVAQQWLHHLAAGRLRRRSAVPRRRQRHPADLSSATCRRS